MKGSKSTKSTTSENSSRYKSKAKRDFPDLLTANYGLINLTCKKANIDKSTYYLWRKKDPEFAKKCDEVKDLIGDMVESKLFNQVRDNVLDAIKFVCRTKYRDRGYMEKSEQDINISSKEKTAKEIYEKYQELFGDKSKNS